VQTTDIDLYQHAKRPDWGLAIAVDELTDRKSFLFEDGEQRTFMNEYAHLMSEVQPTEELVEKARKYFSKYLSRTPSASKRKPPAARKAAKSPRKAKTQAKTKAKAKAKAKAETETEANPAASKATAE